MPTYQQNEDGTWSPAVPMGWMEEHNWFQRLILWVMGRHHCNDSEMEKRSRLTKSGPGVRRQQR